MLHPPFVAIPNVGIASLFPDPDKKRIGQAFVQPFVNHAETERLRCRVCPGLAKSFLEKMAM